MQLKIYVSQARNVTWYIIEGVVLWVDTIALATFAKPNNSGVAVWNVLFCVIKGVSFHAVKDIAIVIIISLYGWHNSSQVTPKSVSVSNAKDGNGATWIGKTYKKASPSQNNTPDLTLTSNILVALIQDIHARIVWSTVSSLKFLFSFLGQGLIYRQHSLQEGKQICDDYFSSNISTGQTY